MRSSLVFFSACALLGCSSPKADLVPSAAAASAQAATSAGPDVAPPGPTAVAAPAASSTASAAASATAEGPTCPAGEIAIPPTPAEGFVMGKGMQRKRGDSPHRVVISRGFCLDQDEVTARRYEDCVKAGKCRVPGQADEWATYQRAPDKPINLVSWIEARVFCAANGQRLPTEAEWEWAARGPGDSTYPWGESAPPTCADGYADFTEEGAPKSNPGGNFGCHGGGPSNVGAHPKGDKKWPAGNIHDLGGNVWEWVEDSWGPYPEQAVGAPPIRDPLLRLETATHAIRGGAWNRHPISLITTYRGAAHYQYHVPGLGFRCARGAPHPTPAPRGGT